MKRILFAIILIGSATLTRAQYNTDNRFSENQRRRPARQIDQAPNLDPKGYVSVTFGFANPVGNFGLNIGNYGNYALQGYSTTISAGVPIQGTNIGFSFLLGQYTNPFDVASFLNNQVQSGQIPSGSYQYNQDNFSFTALMVGGFYTWPMHRFSFDARVLVGALFTYMPDVAFQQVATVPVQGTIYSTQVVTDNYEYPSSTKVLPGFNAGLGLRYSMNRSRCISLHVDYAGVVAGNYSTSLQHTDYSNNAYTSIPVSGPVSWSNLSISIGLGFEFPTLEKR